MAQEKLDSLLNVWQDRSLQDTVRIDALAEATTLLIYSDPERRESLLNELEAMLGTIDDPKRTSKLFNYRGQTHLIKGRYDTALYFFNRSYGILEKAGDVKGQAQIENNIGLVFMYMSNYDSALVRLEGALAKKRAVNNIKSIPSTIMNIGMIHHQRGEHETALDCYLRSYSLEDSLGNEIAAYTSLYHAGAVLNDMGNFPLAREYMLRSLPIAEKHEHSQLQSFIVDLLGAIAFGQDELDEAEQYFLESRELAAKLGSKYSLALSHNNLGELYVKKEQYELAKESLQKGLALAEEIGEKSIESMTCSNLGTLYAILKERELAEKNFLRALLIDDEMQDFHSESSNLQSLGMFYLEYGQPEKAIESCLASYELSTKDVALPLQQAACNCLYLAYKKSGNINKAFDYLEKLRNLEDTLKNEDRAKELTRLQMNFEHEKQQAADSMKFAQQQALKDIELEKQELDLSRQRIALASSGIGLILILVLAFTIYRGKQRAERAERHKEQFLANMSHEIRTPMHAISGMTKILIRNEPADEQRKYLNAISESAGNLLVILNDILDLSKVEEGKLKIEHIPMNPSKIIDNVLDMIRVKAEEKGLRLHLQVDNDVPEFMIGDPTRLNQIMLNLVGNAIKFTENGSVDVKILRNAEKLEIKVEDSGIGIPKEKLDGVFGSFEQVDDSTTRKYGGTGLGLSITKKLVELQNGQIWLESEEGVGSVFTVELPLEEVVMDAESILQKSDEELRALGDSLAGLRVLLVEDEEFNRMVAGDDLAYYIPKVILDVAENGQVGIDKFSANDYDIVLMDIQMPVLSGLDATRRIREIELEKKSSRTPVIAMTASLLKDELDKCFAAGMDGYIPKPYNAEELVGTIHEQLKA